MRRSGWVALAGLAALAGAAGAGSDTPEARAERAVAAWIAWHHANPADVDAAKLARDVAAGAPPQETPAAFERRVAAAAEIAFYAFAPIGAQPDETVRYRLPFAFDVPRYLVQGVDGRYTHQGLQRFAFDFAMPVGSEVVAAREGVVTRVVDGYSRGGLDPTLVDQANLVYVLHDDGSFAGYLHLRSGIAVREGQRVKPGERIGWSGHTGYAAGPHLHFAVYRRNAQGVVESVPIRFGVGSAVGFVPVEGEFYGGRPKRNAELRVLAGGVPCDPDHPLQLAAGASVALSVSLATTEGVVDVTHAPSTHFLAPTAWSVTVDERGRVVAAPSPDYAAALRAMAAAKPAAPAAGVAPAKPAASSGWGIVLVSYEDAGADRYGFASVPVVIGAAKR